MTLRHVQRFDELVRRARALAEPGRRRILGIAGSPASGKGKLAREIVRAVEFSVLVPMDGFHLAEAELHRLGRRDRKGAPDTFDASGYVALLRRIRDEPEHTVYAPEFHREIEESFAGAIAVEPEVSLVVTEGNYLLLDQDPWARVRDLLDEAWFLAPDDGVRVRRLIARHVRYGKTQQEAENWVYRSDEHNAALVERSRERTDLVVPADPELPR